MPSQQVIRFRVNGSEYEAPVDRTSPWPRSRVQDGYLTVEHSSESYVIVIDGGDGEYVAIPINERI